MAVFNGGFQYFDNRQFPEILWIHETIYSLSIDEV